MLNCPVCKVETATKLISDRDKQYTSCPNCEFIFLDPSYYISHTEEKERYLKHNNTPENVGYVKMFTDFLDVAVSPFIAKGSVFDFGCGTYPVLGGILQKRGFVVDLYDYYFYPDWESKDKQYDLVVSTEVLEHIANPHTAFSLFSEIVKPGGYLAIMTLFIPKETAKFPVWWYLKDETHISFFNLKTITSLAKQYGFEVIFCNDKNICTLQKSL